MPKSKLIQSVKVESVRLVTFTLTEESARLLLGMVQNPFSDNEEQRVTDFREELFSMLQKQLR